MKSLSFTLEDKWEKFASKGVQTDMGTQNIMYIIIHCDEYTVYSTK